MGKLTALKVEKLKKPGLHFDGDGLVLQAGKAGGKSWLFRYRFGDKRREMGLGPLSAVSLADARAKAAECRKLIAAGRDPLEAREEVRQAAKLEAAKVMTFKGAAEAYIASHRAG